MIRGFRSDNIKSLVYNRKPLFAFLDVLSLLLLLIYCICYEQYIISAKRYIAGQLYTYEKMKAKNIPVTGRGGPLGFDKSRLPHLVYTVGSQVAVKFSALVAGRPAALYPQEDSWYSFLLEAELTPGSYGSRKD
jgi:hypothetical protein